MDDNIDKELLEKTIEKVQIFGKIIASEDIKKRLIQRMEGKL